MRCVVVVTGIIISDVGIVVLPTTAGAPVIPGVALEVPLGLVTEGIVVGTDGVVGVKGTPYDALVAIIGLVFRARRRAKNPIRRGVVVVVFMTVGVMTVPLTTGVIGVVGVVGGVSAEAVAANAIPITAANKNRFIEASS
jgi:hypothetical protein